jgi:type I restriction enzyme, S subunit
VTAAWTVRKIGSVSTKVGSGATPRGGDAVYVSKGVPFIRSMNVHFSGFKADGLAYLNRAHADELDNVKVQAGDVLLNITGASIGRVTTAPDALAGARVNQHVCIIRPSHELRSAFLANYLASPEQQARVMNVQVGATRQALTKAVILDWDVPIPDLGDQDQIVGEIEKQFTRLEAGVAALRRAQANLKRYRAAVLKAACEGRLVPTEASLAKANRVSFETGEELLARTLGERNKASKGSRQSKAPVAVDEIGRRPLPDGWVWSSLDQLGQEGRPIIYGIIKPGPHVPDGVPYVRVTEMKDGRIDLGGLKRTSPERAAKFARATLAGGDVLISKDGTIGRVAVVPIELAGGNITQHVMRAPIHRYISRDFVVLAIRSDQCQRWLTGETRGVALRGVNVEDFRRLPLPLPPLAEQLRIVAEVERRLSVVDELDALVTANLQRAARLRQSILQRAFSGGLVPPRASD